MPKVFKVSGTSEVTDEQLATLLANGDVTLDRDYKIPILSDEYRLAELPYLVYRWTVEITHKSVPHHKLFNSLTEAARHAATEIERVGQLEDGSDGDPPMRVWLKRHGKIVAQFSGDAEHCLVMLRAVVNAELLDEAELAGK